MSSAGTAALSVQVVAIHDAALATDEEGADLGYRKKLLALVDHDVPEAGLRAGDMLAILDASRFEPLPVPLSEEEVRGLARASTVGTWTLLFDYPIRHSIELAL